jgi:hypothetical protein
MALAFLQELPGVTQEQYDQVIEKFRGKRAQGRIFHVAGPMEGRWRVVDAVNCGTKETLQFVSRTHRQSQMMRR